MVMNQVQVKPPTPFACLPKQLATLKVADRSCIIYAERGECSRVRCGARIRTNEGLHNSAFGVAFKMPVEDMACFHRFLRSSAQVQQRAILV